MCYIVTSRAPYYALHSHQPWHLLCTISIGTERNFMFEWLKPTAAASLDDVKDFLLDRFVLVGKL